VAGEQTIRLESEADLVTARMKGRELARQLGFPSIDQTLIATAISELGRNILRYAGRGEVLLRTTGQNGRDGIVVVARDNGPGIADVGLAMQDGYSTSRGLGMGLPGTKRLMDEFEIFSEPDRGTTVTVTKWLRAQEAKRLALAVR
jgi:serine/threonine-protein kinase RsbT